MSFCVHCMTIIYIYITIIINNNNNDNNDNDNNNHHHHHMIYIYIYIKTLTPFFTALQDRVCHKFKKEKHNEEDFRLEPP